MKVIGLVSSPRLKGNTGRLVTKALEGAKSAGADTEIFYLAEMDINDCKACMSCKRNEGCAQKDDFQKIYDAIMKADRIILGSPVYFFDINGLARLVEDRFYSFVTADMKSRIPPGKKCTFIVSQATPNKDAFIDNLKLHEKSMGMLGIPSTGINVFCGELAENSPELEEAKEIGSKLAS